MYNPGNRAVSIDSAKPLFSSRTLLCRSWVDLGGGADVGAGALEVGPLALDWLLLKVLPAVGMLVVRLNKQPSADRIVNVKGMSVR